MSRYSCSSFSWNALKLRSSSSTGPIRRLIERRVALWRVYLPAAAERTAWELDMTPGNEDKLEAPLINNARIRRVVVANAENCAMRSGMDARIGKAAINHTSIRCVVAFILSALMICEI